MEGVSTPTQIELPVIFPFNFFHFSTPDMSVGMIQSLFVGVTQGGRFRQEGQLNLYYKLFHDFSISVQLYDYFDNQPPGQNAAKIDYGIVFGLNYRFSQ